MDKIKILENKLKKQIIKILVVSLIILTYIIEPDILGYIIYPILGEDTMTIYICFVISAIIFLFLLVVLAIIATKMDATYKLYLAHKDNENK